MSTAHRSKNATKILARKITVDKYYTSTSSVQKSAAKNFWRANQHRVVAQNHRWQILFLHLIDPKKCVEKGVGRIKTMMRRTFNG